MERDALPGRGIVFWPVGNGDSTTIVINPNITVQVDLHHIEKSESDDDPRFPMVDELVEFLPVRDERPYLSAYVGTHADKDHCRGFRELIEDKDVLIGELWVTPRLVADFDCDPPEDLSDDAIALREEAHRRIGLACNDGATLSSGDRIKLIGWHDSIEDQFPDFPEDYIVTPGNSFHEIDGTNLEDSFRAFVHTPFKDDMDADERNKTSIGLHVTLTDGEVKGRFLLLGDLDYPIVKRLLEAASGAEDKEWDVLLAPHHCSKKVMYEWLDGADVLRQDVLDLLGAAKAETGWVVASSDPVPDQNTTGDNPPHAKAKNRYEEISDEFKCTGEHPTADKPEPLMFEVTSSGMVWPSTATGSQSDKSRTAEAVMTARGGTQTASAPVGFGCR